MAEKVGYNADFAQYRKLLLDAGLRDLIPAIRADLDKAEASANSSKAAASRRHRRPACKVEIRYIYQVLRAMPPDSVFAQILLGFELASADPRVVGINLVQPEDGYVAMTDYRLHMQMIDALHALYPKVHITLHAGEIALGLVPPDGLKFHIRDAIEQGHAERIGHGVDVMDEDQPYELLKEMAAKRIMVEINLTSNDVILNVKGPDHPLPCTANTESPSRSQPTTKASPASTSPTNTSAPSTRTTSPTRPKATWPAPASNTTSSPAKASGNNRAKRTPATPSPNQSPLVQPN
jgi:adenosine deaminase